MKVTAEGVETADQQLFLRAAGVHFMQGYRFGKAVTAFEITARLQSPGGARRPGRLTPPALRKGLLGHAPIAGARAFVIWRSQPISRQENSR
jgi:hypothetical protein